MNFAKITSRRALRGTSFAVLALIVSVALGACGSSSGPSAGENSTSTKVPSLNTTRVAASIRDSIYSERQIHARVVCPPSVAPEVGGTFECTAITVSAKNASKIIRTPFVVTIVNSKGYVTYVGK